MWHQDCFPKQLHWWVKSLNFWNHMFIFGDRYGSRSKCAPNSHPFLASTNAQGSDCWPLLIAVCLHVRCVGFNASRLVFHCFVTISKLFAVNSRLFGTTIRMDYWKLVLQGPKWDSSYVSTSIRQPWWNNFIPISPKGMDGRLETNHVIHTVCLFSFLIHRFCL